MNKQQVIKKLKSKSLSEADKIEIFNWYIKNESPQIIAMFDQLPGREFLLKEQQIQTCNTPQAKQMLEYSMIKIKEELGINNKSNMNLMKFLLGFR